LFVGQIAAKGFVMKFLSQRWLVILVMSIAVYSISAAAKPEIDVILWFDTEDYLLPADDDAAKRLAEMLTQRGIRATFKVVGEKARVLEQRGRRDVIAALQRHDIGFHADFHSVHPTPSEYLADCGLLDGMAEFARREGDGAADVRRIFGVKTLSCYGQPGSSWGSQTIAGLKQIGVAPHGIPCYVDEGDHVGLNNQPFWYCNALVVYKMGRGRAYTRMDLHSDTAIAPAKKEVSAMADRMRNEGGGLISIFYHPCEWVHVEFWDGVNFRRGANPPREQWKPPPQRPPEQTEAAFKRFAEYIDHIHALGGVRFVTASDLPDLYPDPVRTVGVSDRDLTELVDRIRAGATTGLDAQIIDGRAYSVGDQFELLTVTLGEWLEGKSVRFPLVAKGLLGPDAPPPPSRTPTQLAWPAFRDATVDVLNFIRTEKRVPARVFIDADPVPPADFLVALASAYSFNRKNGALPYAEGVALGQNVRLLPARRVAEDTPELFGGWVIHKEGFRAPRILEVARLQTWTLKPAIRKSDQ
jgi:hypothetical protein